MAELDFEILKIRTALVDNDGHYHYDIFQIVESQGARLFSSSSTKGHSPSDLQRWNRAVVVSFNAWILTARKIISNIVADSRRELVAKQFEKHPFGC